MGAVLGATVMLWLSLALVPAEYIAATICGAVVGAALMFVVAM